ncbi:thermonuclease family protein [Bacillus sp. EB600]|nr:thermonuclease family protein [Bacillus sp. EB600]
MAACSQGNVSNSDKKASTSAAQTTKTEKVETTKESNLDQTNTAQNSDNPASSTASTQQTQASNNTSDTTQSEPTTNQNQVPVSLVETVDGDTIKVNYDGKETTVRYLLVDTPEEKKPGTCVQPFAMDAANRNKQLVNSGKLTLEFEEHNKTDKYGRLLAYVYVNGQSVQETLLKEGYARVAYIYYPPYKHLSEYQADENMAKGKGLNIWSKAGYSTSNGFVGCVSSGTTTQNSSTSGTTQPKPVTASSSTTTQSTETEYFANCTELRKKYPDGVPKGHPAYQDKMDRDKDGYACER